jgi:hypothetical protein
MQATIARRALSGLLALVVAGSAALSSQPASAAPWSNRGQFADSGFRDAWARADAEQVRGGRSWYWGPGPWFDYAEFYRQGVNSLRTVQYFDKARMEINNPGDRSYQNGVTNGLLVKELVSGRVQLGNDPYDYDERGAADVPVAGNPLVDNPNAPSYRSFASVASIDNGYRDPNRLGQRVESFLDKGGNISIRSDLSRAETEIVQYNANTGHNIPRVFWDFMNLQGAVLENGQVRQGPVVDWTFAMGLPISDAYWTRAKIGASERNVLVQLFERRVLTYTPDNPAGYQVEMGNVGQHYFQWRYPHLGQPWAAPDANVPLLFASDVDTGGKYWELYFQGAGGRVRLTNEQAESVAFSYRRSYEPRETRILIDSRRSDNTHRQVFELNVPAFAQDFSSPVSTRRISYTDGKPVPPNAPYQGYLPNGSANDFNASYSPDGTKIIFVSDRNGRPELFITNAQGNSPSQLTTDGCLAQVPTWSPDGRTIYWERKCGDGPYTVMRADLAYGDDRGYGVYATLLNISELTSNSSGDNRFPRVSPDGRQVVFTSYRDGNAEIYLMNSDGSGQKRLTNNAAEDEAATWNAAGTQLAFGSTREDGRYKIYLMDASGNNVSRYSNTGGNDRWPLWAQ